MAKHKTWKVIDWGDVPEGSPTVPFGGPCGHEAMLPVRGTVIAETSGGMLIFDSPGLGATPATIHCRRCGRTYTNAPEEN